MPGCFRAKKEDKKLLEDWPEPPGYLGEAVRRAKRIPSAMEASVGRPAPQPQPQVTP